jgi:hypothetical protein
MTQPRNVIYLPPGVVPPEPASSLQPEARAPFDRQFFEAMLPQAVASFCKQVECDAPRVEVYTTDGTVHYVNAISGVTDTWVALYASREEHKDALELFLPYQTVYRVEIHPESDENRRHLGFVAPLAAQQPPAVQEQRPSAKSGVAPLAVEKKATGRPAKKV